MHIYRSPFEAHPFGINWLAHSKLIRFASRKKLIRSPFSLHKDTGSMTAQTLCIKHQPIRSSPTFIKSLTCSKLVLCLMTLAYSKFVLFQCTFFLCMEVTTSKTIKHILFFFVDACEVPDVTFLKDPLHHYIHNTSVEDISPKLKLTLSSLIKSVLKHHYTKPT